jgi:hypothetical protein
MWFHGKSPEEIKERLRKEGFFTKLREDAKLDPEIMERARQERITQGEKVELIESFIQDVLLPRLEGTKPRKNEGEKKGKPLRLKTDIKAGSPVVIGNPW